MAKRRQDLKPDIVLKNYWNNNEQFADIFNAVLFGGRQYCRCRFGIVYGERDYGNFHE